MIINVDFLEIRMNPHHMVYGKFGDKLDSNYVSEAIPLITYRQSAINFAEANLKGSKRRESMSKNQKSMAVFCYVDDKTLNRNQTPMVNMIIVFGANRFN